MKNIVPCKRCKKEFEYTPGIAGNARQLCEDCRRIADDEELEQFKEKMIIEGNRYLFNSLNQKNKYDPVDILVDGNMPKFENDADKFICATRAAYLIRKSGITGIESNLIKLFDILDIIHVMLIIKQQTMQTVEIISRDPRFKQYTDQITKVFNEKP